MNEIAKTTNTALALPQMNVSELQTVGELFERSGMFGCSQQGQGMVLAMTCVMQGMTPLDFIRTYHIIDGKPAMKAEAMLAKFVERGGEYKIEERSATRAAATFTKGANSLAAEYTMAEAEKQGICLASNGKTLKANWQKFPKQMLWARLISDSIRAIDPGVNMGAYTPEEVQDLGGNEKYTPPVPFLAEEKPRKAKKTDRNREPEPQTIDCESVEVSDPDEQFDSMPAGNLQGKKWGELDTEQLIKIAASNHKAITAQHKERIYAELTKRGEKPF